MSKKNNKIKVKPVFWLVRLITISMILMMIVPTTSALSTSEIEFDKMPLAPGETTDIWFEVRNDGTDTLHNVVLTLQQSAETRTSIGILDGSAGLGNLNPRDRAKVHFTIYAAPDAEDGIYNFDIDARYEVVANRTDIAQAPLTLTTVTVQVFGEPPYLIISDTSDNIVAPGTTKHITVTIRNVGTDVAEDVFMEINPIPDTEGSKTTSTPDLGGLNDLLGSSMTSSIPGMSSLMGGGEEAPPPFVVTGSGNRFFVGDLKPGLSRDVTFMISADSGAQKGVYNLPITLHRRNGKSTSEYIGVIVSSKAELNVPDIRTDPKYVEKGESAILMVTVENIGKNDAKSVRVELMENNYLTGEGSDYVGTISPDEDDTALFEISVLEVVPEIIPVTFRISYQDETGDYSFVEKGDINVKELSTEESSSESVYTIPVFGVVLAVLITVMVVFYRKKQGLFPSDDVE